MAEIEANIELEAEGDKIKEVKVANKHKRCISSTGDISKLFEIVQSSCMSYYLDPGVATSFALKSDHKAGTGEDWKSPAVPTKAPSSPKVKHDD